MSEKEQTDSNSSDPKKNDNDATNAYYWKLVLFGALAFISLIFVSVSLPYLNERAKFFTENALSLSILIAVVVQAIISNRQWKTMHDGLDRTDKVIEKMERQLDAMKVQSGLIQQQVDLAVANERAYLRLRDWKSPKFENGFLILEARLMNGGRTPAWEVQGHTRVGVDYAPRPYPRIPSAEEESLLDAQPFLAIAVNDTAVLPFTPLKVTDAQMVLIQEGKMQIFVDGVSRYLDSLGGKNFYTYGFTVNWDGPSLAPRYERHHRVKAD